MSKLTIVGKNLSYEEAGSLVDTSRHQFQLVDADHLPASTADLGQLTVIVAWPQFHQVLAASPALAGAIRNRLVVVVGSYSHFTTVEDLILQGAVTFIATPTTKEAASVVFSEVIAIYHHNQQLNQHRTPAESYSAAS